jgi:excinuclease UvrABC nuclease subunit
LTDYAHYLDVSKLPSMPLSKKKHFPAIACVYLVVDEQDVVHYVGRTINLLNRWTNHHKYSQVLKLQQPRVVYLVASLYLVPDVEAFLIRTLQPSLNIKVPGASDLINIDTL